MRKSKYWPILVTLAPLLIGLPLLSLPFFSRSGNLPAELRNELLQSAIITNILLIIIFYLHTYLIYPIRERKNGLWIYAGLLLLCLGVFLFASSLFMPEMPRFPAGRSPFPQGMPHGGGRPGPRFPLIGVLTFSFVILASFSYKLYMDKVQGDKLIKERENILLKTELAFLSSQISPHFMFNVLNTLVAMARKKSELLEPSLISLSQLMRYMLYDNNGSKISLTDEIEYLHNYINLQLLRFGDSVKVMLDFQGPFEHCSIAPMLLIPFVENAFKHGIGVAPDPVISISLRIDEDAHSLNLVVINDIASPDARPDRNSGIGLVNVRRRLELLYPGKHQLEVYEKDHSFTARLQINL